MAVHVQAYEIGNDRVPETYRDYFDNADWTLHKLVVSGSWGFFVLAIIFHIFVFSLR